MRTNTLDISAFKEHFDRGQFTYGELDEDNLHNVRDKDIVSAIAEMQGILNPEIYSTDELAHLAKLYLTAHFLVSDLQASKSGGSPSYNVSSRSAGSRSESISIPDWMQESEYSFYATTYYGQKWLVLTRSCISTVMGYLPGGTRP